MFSPCLAGCLRRDSRATAIVTAAASTASPMTCPPMSRTSKGKPADRSTVCVPCVCFGSAAAEPVGEGDTCGKAEPRSPLGWTPRPGMVVPLGSAPAGGSVPPSPAFGVGDEVGLGFFGLMSTVADAVAEFDACDEVAVAVSMKRVVGRFGAATLACSWGCAPVLRLVVHVDVPVAAQTEKAGARLFGFADRVTFTLPLPLVSQIQMAYRTVVCGSTALTPLSVCILMHSVPCGGAVVGVVVGVGEVVGVAVAVAVGLVVALGDFCVPPGVSGFAEVDELLAGAGCGSVLGAGAAEEPGLGWGSDGALALGLGWELGSGADDWLPACFWLAYASSTGMPAGCCARAPVWAAERGSALVLAVAAGLADVQGFELAWRVPCTPVSIMLTAP